MDVSKAEPSAVRLDALRFRDWEFRGTLSNGAQVWNKAGVDVVFPSGPGAVDFQLRLRLAVEEVARVEDVSPTSISEELMSRVADTVFWRLESGAEPGEIDLSTLERSLNAIRRVHVYSAAAYEARRSLYGKRITRRARSMSQRLRVGLTRQGSYILPVSAQPDRSMKERLLTQLVHEGEIFDFEAGSLRLLADALAALRLHLGADVALTPDTLLSMVESGVSYELVVALIDLLEPVRIEHVDFLLLASPEVGKPAPKLRFAPADVEGLSKLRATLFGANITGAEIIVATVKETSRTERGDRAAVGGRVKLRRIGGASKRTLLIADLNEVDYQSALDANGKRDQVELRARVVEEPGKVPRLEDVEYLRRRVQSEVDLGDR